MQKQTITFLTRYILATFLAILTGAIPAKAYSLLTHEAIIDASWKRTIEPLLLRKYPGSTSEQLLTAHAYAYGGAIMPDIGYSPFGSMLYTNLVHNVRTGDYVRALLDEAADINEYAFALGSLAHYTADIYGHSVGTNIAVPITYPKLKAEFGDVITYAEHPKSHSRVELAFDVLQTARGNYATKAYHDFIGFKVSGSVIERAFLKTYGLNVKDVFRNLPLAISTYRWVVKSLLPNLVRTAWANKKGELKKADPSITSRNFSYRIKNRAYYAEYGKDLQKAGFIPSIISVIIPILPKIGPLAKLRFKAPSAEAEKLFIESFDTTLLNYESSLNTIQSVSLHLPNLVLDTGDQTVLGGYPIADETYFQLLSKLKESDFQNVRLEISNDLTSFYSGRNQAPITKKDIKRSAVITEGLAALNHASPK